MQFLMLDGEGHHSSEGFVLGTRWLMSVIRPIKPIATSGWGSYVEPPLEVLWWADDMNDFMAGDRARWKWRPEEEVNPIMARLYDEFLPEHHVESG
ncbi:MAG TPA: hypothetical protein VFH11_01605 [Gemmatimonadota bacterium]|nr:hypothetical protein [Gemmatimonadota bacterium]